MYPLIGVAGNVGMVMAGAALHRFADQRDVMAASVYLQVKRRHGGLAAGNSSSLLGTAGSVVGSRATVEIGVVDRLRGYEQAVERATDFSTDPQSAGWARTLMTITAVLTVSALGILACYDAVYSRRRRFFPAQHIKGCDRADRSPLAEPSQPAAVLPARVRSSLCRLGCSLLTPLPPPPFPPRFVTLTAAPDRLPACFGSHLLRTQQRQDSVDSADSGVPPSWLGAENQRLGTITGDPSSATLQPPSQRGKPTLQPPSQRGGRRRTYSFMRSINTLSGSLPLRCIALLVVSYGVSSSLLEVSWKGQVKHLYKSPNDYSRFMASFWQPVSFPPGIAAWRG